jgi:hypothetical protein
MNKCEQIENNSLSLFTNLICVFSSYLLFTVLGLSLSVIQSQALKTRHWKSHKKYPAFWQIFEFLSAYYVPGSLNENLIKCSSNFNELITLLDSTREQTLVNGHHKQVVLLTISAIT